MGLTYRDSGVDVEGGNAFVKKIAPLVKETFSSRVITDIGGFGALFRGSFPEMKDPVLVSGTDGVGTKLQIAQKMNVHDTIGIDAVAMCVNDIVVSGAMPLFFLDYISCGRLNESVLVDVIRGIAEGCKLAGCSLVGGETAEHPNIMNSDEYDIAGFAVGVVDREKIINGSRIKAGDKIIGLPSSGIHSNGYSMVRKLFLEMMGYDLNTKFPELSDTLGRVLLRPTKIYVKSILNALGKGCDIKGLVHITGGGFYENIPRILPESAAVSIEKSAFVIPDIFSLLQRDGKVEDREMFTTFNMGIGMMAFVPREEESSVVEALKESGEEPVVIGEVIPFAKEKVIIK
ncbi:MAG: phosphoribosylformylglycinamidine cyclo-ligase [Spirochaetae bacterium HGW-Spirochaetae-1]|nr:MAG: phosphoribosylformylglycinamidine cyclo-ligase [Spirochaetae bacterium HGW-Spirochaetae-1]